MFGEHPLPTRRLLAFIRCLPGDSALARLSIGTVTDVAPVSTPVPNEVVVTRLAGMNLDQLLRGPVA